MWGANPQWWWLKCLLKAQMSNAHFKVIRIFVMKALPFSHQISSKLFFTNDCFGDCGRRGEVKRTKKIIFSTLVGRFQEREWG